MRADNGEHIPSGTPLESLLSNTKINKFNLSISAAIKNILRFNVTMTNIVIVQIANCDYEFLNDMFEILLVEMRTFSEVRRGEVLHYQIGVTVVKVKSTIFQDGVVVQLLQVDKAFL
jgi:hypothetical protein